MEREKFEAFVVQAIKTLPKFFKAKLENVGIVIEDFPSIEIQNKMNKGPYELLGLYQGVPLPKRGVWYRNVLPDKIIIYQKPIERIAQTEDEIKNLVRKVLMHEIGHYYGLSEEELKDAGA
ncbi:MAG: metallopeptidase family protein [candidate division WOR-3 bacterium]|nr:metallopeptidase family protein [candidate division WOR-3 bacterium]